MTTGYGDLRGDAGLREKLARDVEGAYGFEDDKVDEEKEVVLTAGCNLAFYATMVSLAGAGDEIILPTPWVRLLLFRARSGAGLDYGARRP